MPSGRERTRLSSPVATRENFNGEVPGAQGLGPEPRGSVPHAFGMFRSTLDRFQTPSERSGALWIGSRRLRNVPESPGLIPDAFGTFRRALDRFQTPSERSGAPWIGSRRLRNVPESPGSVPDVFGTFRSTLDRFHASSERSEVPGIGSRHIRKLPHDPGLVPRRFGSFQGRVSSPCAAGRGGRPAIASAAMTSPWAVRGITPEELAPELFARLGWERPELHQLEMRLDL